MYSYFQCPNCSRAPRVLTRRFESFFDGIDLPCPACRTPLAWWDTLKEIAVSTGSKAAGYLPELVGLRHSVSTHPIDPGNVIEISLDEVGVPDTAVVVLVRSEPTVNPDFFEGRELGPTVTDPSIFGDLITPPSTYLTTPSLTRKPLGRSIRLYTGDGGQFREEWKVAVAVKLWVSWVDFEGKPEAWRLLGESLLANYHGDTRSALVLANTACEGQMWRLMDAVLKPYASKDHRKRFLSDGATYSHQLNVMLPLLADLLGWPALNDTIRGQLNRLRSLRNDQVHGLPESDLATSEKSVLLLAAVFGVHYLLYMERRFAALSAPTIDSA